MPSLTIRTARRAIALCLAGTAISAAMLVLDRASDVSPPPAGATSAAHAAEPPGMSATSAPNASAKPAALLSMAATAATAGSSPGISVTPAPNVAPSSPAPAAPSTLLTQAQLAQLVAPIALYPDPLLAQILMASTYPLELVEAERWVNINGNRALNGDALTAALQVQNWDPSVKALVTFPRVLQMMNDQLQWSQELGNAFLAQQGDLMAAVQSLRQEAMAAGSLKQTPQCRCVIHSRAGTISILPAQPQVVCAPVYTPAVYGVWPYPAYQPYYFPMPVGFVFAPGVWIGFTPPVELAAFGPFWGWGWIDWGHRWIAVDTARLALVSGGAVWFSGNVWVHDPVHRGGVPYADPATRGRFEATRVTALNAAARGGGAVRFAARGSEAFHGGAAGFNTATHGGLASFRGEASSRGAPGVHTGMALHDGTGFRAVPAAHGGGVRFHGASGAHNGIASHGGGAGFRVARATHGAGAVHGASAGFHAGPAPRGGGHFAAPHFAMGAARGGGPGGGAHEGGPHGGGGAGGHHG